LRELARSYLTVSKDQGRVMSRLKALYRSWGIACSGQQVNTGLVGSIVHYQAADARYFGKANGGLESTPA
jgi:hypothetical protein